MTDIQNLKRLAEEALDADDENGKEGWFTALYLSLEFGDVASFMAATSPSTILSLMQRVEELQVYADRYRFMRTRDVTFEAEDGPEFISYIPELGHDGSKLDVAIDAAIAAQSTKEQG